MSLRKGAGFWLATLGVALGGVSSRAAVMTSSIRSSSGAAPYSIGYNLAQDVTSMSVKIHNATSGAVVRTFTVTNTAAFTKGAHTADVTWDGNADNGVPAPSGFYYVEIITAGAAIPTLTSLTDPINLNGVVNGVDRTDGRNYYGLGVDNVAGDPYFNNAFEASRTNGNAGTTQVNGTRVVNADATSLTIYPSASPDTSSFDWVSADVTSDAKVVLGGQTTGTVPILNTDGTVFKTLPPTATNLVFTREIRVSGTASNGNMVFGDAGSKPYTYPAAPGTPASNNGGVDMISLSGTALPTPVVLIPRASLPANSTTLAAKFDASNNPTIIWVGTRASSTTSVPASVIYKFLPPAGGTGVWTRDTSFTAAVPAGLTLVQPFLRLSRDGNTLWLANNNGSDNTQNFISGLDPATGALKGANYSLVTAWDPQEMATSVGGNIYVTSYAGNITGVTSNQVGVVAPPDNGSTDDTRGTSFQVTADTNIRITNLAVIKTYHSFTVTYDTNYPSDTELSYDTQSTPPLGTTVMQDTGVGVTHHVITVDGLDQATQYYFQVASAATGFNTATSAVTAVTTNTLTIDPASVHVTNITDASATVTFTTNDTGLGIVRYSKTSGGEDPDNAAPDARHPGELGNPTYSGDFIPNPVLGTTHSVLLSGLAPNTTYYFQAETGFKPADPTLVFATRPSDSVDTAEASFTTVGTIKVTSETLTADAASATLNINTTPATTATVHYGTAANTLTGTITVASGSTHAAAFTGLAAGTTYYYTVDLAGAGVAPITTPVSVFATDIAGGTAQTVTHSAATDFTPSYRSQIAIGGSGHVTLETQGVPDIPVTGIADQTKAPDLPQALRYTALVAHNGYLYSLGGQDAGGTRYPVVYVSKINADGSLGAWATTTPMPQERGAHTNQCFAYNGYLYVVSGALQGGTTINTVYYAKQNPADGTVGTWQAAPVVPSERDLSSAACVDGTVFLLGGESNTGDDPRNNVFQASIHADGSLGAWIQTRVLKDGVYLHRSVTNAHNIYQVSGLSDPVAANYKVADINTVDIASTQANSFLTPFLRDTTDLGHADGAEDAQHYGMGTGLLHGKIVTVGGRIQVANYNDTISLGLLNADGSTGAWTTFADTTFGAGPTNADHAYPIPLRDNDCAAYNGFLYCGTGRGGDGNPTSTIGYLPFVADPNLTGYVYNGSLESQVIDLGAVNNLKHLTVSATGGSVEVRYRFANTDAVFSDWFTLSGLDGDISGGARYFQYELVLSGNGSATPTVNSVSLTAGAASSPLSSADVTAALRIAGGLQKATATDKTRLDADGDGKITLLDAVKIDRSLNGH